jgi:hypothetical protein
VGVTPGHEPCHCGYWFSVPLFKLLMVGLRLTGLMKGIYIISPNVSSAWNLSNPQTILWTRELYSFSKDMLSLVMMLSGLMCMRSGGRTELEITRLFGNPLLSISMVFNSPLNLLNFSIHLIKSLER